MALLRLAFRFALAFSSAVLGFGVRLFFGTSELPGPLGVFRVSGPPRRWVLFSLGCSTLRVSSCALLFRALRAGFLRQAVPPAPPKRPSLCNFRAVFPQIPIAGLPLSVKLIVDGATQHEWSAPPRK